MIIITARKSNSKKQFQHGVRIISSLQQVFHWKLLLDKNVSKLKALSLLYLYNIGTFINC